MELTEDTTTVQNQNASLKRSTEGASHEFQESSNMSEAEIAVLSLLQHGRTNAIKERALVSATGLQGVFVREIIRSLIMNHSVPVASCAQGFFIAETEDEISSATKSLRHRGIMIIMRAAKLQKISVEEVFGQARMEFKEENKSL